MSVSVGVCMWVCAYVWVYVGDACLWCMYVCGWVYVGGCMCVRVWVGAYVCECGWVHVCGHVCGLVHVCGWMRVCGCVDTTQRIWLWTVPRVFAILMHYMLECQLCLKTIVFSNRENLASDCFQGCFVVTCTLCAFISLVWLREQILHGGGPDWLEQDNQAANQARVRCTESEKVLWEGKKRYLNRSLP